MVFYSRKTFERNRNELVISQQHTGQQKSAEKIV